MKIADVFRWHGWRRITRGRGIRRASLTALMIAAAGVAAVQGLHSRDAAPAGEWVPVQAQPLAQPIMAEGVLQAASSVNISAPFDGKIVRRWVQAGDEVKAGAPLVQMDTSEVMAELREAEVAQIRARETLDELRHWSSSAEVASARRQLAATHSQAEAARGRLTEMRGLFDKGIIARTELDAAQSELSNATEQRQTAQDTLSSVLRKGSAEQLRIAQLEFDQHADRVAQVRERLARATLTAPQAGVVLTPAAEPSSGTSPKDFEVGSFASARDVLMSIGDTTTFAVQAQLDGFDVVRVRPGMQVDVRMGVDGEAALHGELQRVSAQAKRDSAGGGSGPPMFDIQVLIRDVPAEVRARLRLGMAAGLRITVELEASALTVPLAAVNRDATSHAFVMRRASSGQAEPVAVQTGRTLPDRVVVLQGLAAGDAVWVPQQPMPRRQLKAEDGRNDQKDEEGQADESDSDSGSGHGIGAALGPSERS